MKNIPAAHRKSFRIIAMTITQILYPIISIADRTMNDRAIIGSIV